MDPDAILLRWWSWSQLWRPSPAAISYAADRGKYQFVARQCGRVGGVECRRSAQVHAIFGARFGVCGSKFSGLRYMMEDRKRFKILAENENGFVFETL